MRGAWSHLDQISADQLYLAGRQFTALVGTATVALTYAAGRRWGPGVALFAAAFMAVMPNHVRESHYVLTDIPTTFFTTLTLLLALRATERGTTWSIAAAGLAAGLAASCKYNGGMAVVFPLIAAVELGGGWQPAVRRAAIVAGAAILGFLLGTPYALLDLPAFLNDYARLAAIFARERGGDPGWSIYLKHFGNSVAQPALAAVGAGLLIVAGRGVRRETERGRALMLLSFVAVYFFVMSRSFQIYARYLLPLLPLLSIACGVGLMSLVGWVRGRATSPWVPRLVGAALTVAILATPAISAVQFGRSLAGRSTIGAAYNWIVRHVPKGSRVVVEYGALKLPNTYPAVGARLLVSRTIDDYRQDGVDYFVAAGPEFQQVLRDPAADPSLTSRYRALLASTKEVASFDPGEGVGGPPIRVFRLVK
jgi:4-amino-4-deoxy-L-arabinose transferase-like glycosyltransferase